MTRQTTQMRRIRRELETVRRMIGLYCRRHHDRGASLCDECEALWVYAQQRTQHCPFGAEKPTCAKCPIHCYKPKRREQIRQVMRYAGPRMLWRHPILSLFHLLDGRRKAPPRPRAKRASDPDRPS